MRFNEKSLRKWINPQIGIDMICNQITRSGLEVEDIQDLLNFGGDLIIGNIVSFRKDISLNHLYIVCVQISEKNILTVISDANNIRNNMKVVVAPIGSKIFPDKIINAFTLSNITSEGVLCSFFDINMFGSKSEIIELPKNAPLGRKLKDYDFYHDKIIKLSITSNRMDVFGVFGVARDVSILNNLSYPIFTEKNISVSISEKCIINLQDCNFVCKYRGRLIKNINLRVKTPLWIREYLRRCFVHPVNVVVDILNYVFLELGQSVNVFSYFSNLKNVFLRFANNNETIKINKKNQLILNNKVIVISDEKNIISFLGNVNFDIFPINLDYTNLFIGSIFIDPELLQYSNYNLKLNNPNLILNDYNIDPGFQIKTIEYVTYLFLSICKGEPGPIVKYTSLNYCTFIKKIRLYFTHIKRILGYDIHSTILYSILNKLGYQVVQSNNYFIVTPPTWRLDIAIEEDVISDIMRIYQYDNIVSEKLCIFKEDIVYDLPQSMLKRVKFLLIDKGYHEVINYSFVDPTIQNVLFKNQKFVSLKNPISFDMSSMRFSLFSGLIKNILYHQNRQHEEIRLFESGLCFSSDLNNTLCIKQDFMLAGVIGSINYKKYWNVSDYKVDFYDLKGDLESIFDVLGCFEDIRFTSGKINLLHSHQSLLILFKNEVIGSLGALNPFLLRQFRLNYSIFYFELFWDKLSFQELVSIKNISEFPSSKRDISVIVSEDILVGDILEACKNALSDNLVEIRIYDIYRGSTIPINKKSISFSLIFQHMSRTLQENEIDFMINICINILKIKFQAILRN
ncbi:phenylalanine--tRNA ligase subunit beta [Buchnera aphidicola]|uniref:phenylalanine--tRNA ligase subunit beta n=1 Tax=Buchnera aphidicola TaxID=9 RepID=UPI0034640FB2